MQNFRSVPIGDELLHEFLMFSLGVPLSKNWLRTYLSTVERRVKQILHSVPEFQHLPDDVKEEIVATNVPLASALVLAKNEVSTGAQQVNFIISVRTVQYLSWLIG